MKNSIILQELTPDELFSKIRELIAEELSKKLELKTPPSYLTKQEVSDKLRLSLPTVTRLTSMGRLSGYRIGRRILYLSDEIDQALTEIETLKYKRS